MGIFNTAQNDQYADALKRVDSLVKA